MNLDKNTKAFFVLLRAGLWEQEVRLRKYGTTDYSQILQMATEQSVVGLIAAGLERTVDVQIPQAVKLQFVGQAVQLEQRNKAMNAFVERLIERLRAADIYAILVKGQGIGHCYERPLWRACGDVDLLLSEDNYEKAKALLVPLATIVETEYKSLKHLGMKLKDGFEVELHGMLHSRLSGRIDEIIDEAQKDIFYHGSVRSWNNNGTQVFLPSPDNDVIFVFTHILKHFYIEGIGLRQICDWCRLLYTYKDTLDIQLLEARLKRAGLMTEWKTFYTLAVKYLGMSVTVSGFMFQDSNNVKWEKKADRIMEFVLEVGNFGHNRTYKRSGNFLTGKIQGAWYKLRDFICHARIFPLDSMKFFFHYALNGVSVAKDMRRGKYEDNYKNN